MDQTHLSQAAHDRLQEELAMRSGPNRRDLADTIERARELGDLKENADYHAAKNEQGFNEARIRQIDAMLKDVVIVDTTAADVVAPGTIVGILIEGEAEATEYLIGSIEERPGDRDVLSTSSPLGRVLMGKAVGDRASYETPRKTTLNVEVVTIRSAE